MLTLLEAGVVLVGPSQGFSTFIALEVFTLHLAGKLHNAISAPLEETPDERLYLYNLHHVKRSALLTPIPILDS